jgi:hypothetical protein
MIAIPDSRCSVSEVYLDEKIIEVMAVHSSTERHKTSLPLMSTLRENVIVWV